MRRPELDDRTGVRGPNVLLGDGVVCAYAGTMAEEEELCWE